MEPNYKSSLQNELNELLLRVFKLEPIIALEELASFEKGNGEKEEFKEIKSVFSFTKAKIHEDIGEYPEAISIYNELLEVCKNKIPKDNYEIGVNTIALIRLMERSGSIDDCINLADSTLKNHKIGLSCALPLLNFLAENVGESHLENYKGEVREISNALGVTFTNEVSLSDAIRKLFKENKRAARSLTILQGSMPDPVTAEYIGKVQQYVDEESVPFYKKQAQTFLDYLQQSS